MVHIQIRDVPDEVAAELRRRAAGEGLTQREYVLRLLRRDQRRPPVSEWLRSAEQLPPVAGRPAADDLAELRGERR